jgi:hypothetical protein
VREELKALTLHRLARAREASAEGEQLLAAGHVMGATNGRKSPRGSIGDEE